MKPEGKPTFQAKPWYNPHGDCIIFQIADEAFVAQRVDELLTIYDAVSDGCAIGFQIKGVHAILKKFGFDGLSVISEADSGGVKSISIAALLLAAYEEGPSTLARRKAYASVMECAAERRSHPRPMNYNWFKKTPSSLQGAGPVERPSSLRRCPAGGIVAVGRNPRTGGNRGKQKGKQRVKGVEPSTFTLAT